MASQAQILTNLDFLLTAEPAKVAEKETKVKKEKILKEMLCVLGVLGGKKYGLTARIKLCKTKPISKKPNVCKLLFAKGL